MLNLKEVKETINNGLYQQISKIGYKFKKSNNEFVRSANEFDYIFYLIYTKWSNYITLNTYAYLRHKQVEMYYAKLIGGAWKENWTLGSEICNIKNTPDGRTQINVNCTISMQNDEDVKNAIGVIKEHFFSVAVPFYEEYDNLFKIDELYNEPPFKDIPVLVQRTLADQCMKGLIIAKLVKRSNYKELTKTFDKLITIPEDDDALREYEKVKLVLASEPSLGKLK